MNDYVVEHRRPVSGQKDGELISRWVIAACPWKEALKTAHDRIKTSDGEYLVWLRRPDIM